jgi:hypothetical protein
MMIIMVACNVTPLSLVNRYRSKELRIQGNSKLHIHRYQIIKSEIQHRLF